MLLEFILRARIKSEGAEVVAGRSQDWGLGDPGGKSRAGRDGQVLGAGVAYLCSSMHLSVLGRKTMASSVKPRVLAKVLNFSFTSALGVWVRL